MDQGRANAIVIGCSTGFFSSVLRVDYPESEGGDEEPTDDESQTDNTPEVTDYATIEQHTGDEGTIPKL